MSLEDEKKTYFKVFWVPVGTLVFNYLVLTLLAVQAREEKDSWL